MGNKKLVYINIDGFSFSYFDHLRCNKQSEGFDRLLLDGILFSNLSSGLISITNPMQSAILCGAWSNKTHNFYHHYDVEKWEIVKHKRTFDAENIAQCMMRNGKSVLSIHQFMLENNPCKDGDVLCPYVRCTNDPSNSMARFDILKRMALGKPIQTGDTTIVYNELPDFTALYVDDIDSLGHNNDYEDYPRRATFEDRQHDIQERLAIIQRHIEDFVNICKGRGFFDDLILLVTTDHGMTPFYGKSSLPDIINRLNEVGLKTALPENRTSETQLIALPFTIESALYCVKPLSEDQTRLLLQVCREQSFMQAVLEKSEMQSQYGLDSKGPDFLLCPIKGHHFCPIDIPDITYAASHDSLDETSQHIFGMLLGGAVCKGTDYAFPTSAIDLLPTILAKQYGFSMRDSTGKVHNGWFEKELK